MSTDTPPPAAPSRRKRQLLSPLLVRREEAAALVDMGSSTFDRHDAAGLLPAGRKLGGCKVWSVRELRAWSDRGCPPRAEWEPLWQALLNQRRRK